MAIDPEIQKPLEKTPDYPVSDEVTEEERLSAYSERLGIPLKRHILQDLDFRDTFGIPIHYFKRMGFIPLNT